MSKTPAFIDFLLPCITMQNAIWGRKTLKMGARCLEGVSAPIRAYRASERVSLLGKGILAGKGG